MSKTSPQPIEGHIAKTNVLLCCGSESKRCISQEKLILPIPPDPSNPEHTPNKISVKLLSPCQIDVESKRVKTSAVEVQLP